MTDLRQAAMQALEALDTLYRSLSPESVLAADLKRRADALREALEQPEQEPVAAFYVTKGGEREFDDWLYPLPVGRNLLYTTPPATQQRKPLTDEQIANIVQAAAKGSAFRRDGTTSTRIARAIEAAHGIKEET